MSHRVLSYRSLTLQRSGAKRRLRAGGFTMVSALFVLVVLAALGAAMASLSVRQQLGSAAEIDAARGLHSARAGLEWAAFQVLARRDAETCDVTTNNYRNYTRNIRRSPPFTPKDHTAPTVSHPAPASPRRDIS